MTLTRIVSALLVVVCIGCSSSSRRATPAPTTICPPVAPMRGLVYGKQVPCDASPTSIAKPTITSTATTTTERVAGRVILGRVWGPGGQEGYGQTQPSLIFNGGDPTGLVEDVRWRSWGGDRAIASGFSYFPHTSVADSTREPVTVVAFALGRCRGTPAYTAIEWYFPQHGDVFDPKNYINICTGDYVGSP